MPLWEFDPIKFREIIEINLLGVFHCCRAIVPTMRNSGWGRIANVASVAGKEGNPNAGRLQRIKGRSDRAHQIARQGARQSGVLVNCVTPATVDNRNSRAKWTPRKSSTCASRIPMGRLGTVEDNAAMIAFLCSDEVSFSTGATFDVSGGRTTY